MERSDGREEIKVSKILRSKMSRFIAYILLLGMLSPALSPLCAQEGADSPQRTEVRRKMSEERIREVKR